ncbi:Protein-associating with the carboxyl-terminal domain of ezrin [Amphibalanus amphitrite]|uniref:Protein-associating with the carboxyl-terminal domain of ezrin n=1 Tax=Amphibalanus amphitrite TaxID=1232801 RepID=A0A6A4W082_AMPAM|nr:Protein-associating with the carboxyl-terminal domain of ezrin [Amphibalanus amphitrite]
MVLASYCAPVATWQRISLPIDYRAASSASSRGNGYSLPAESQTTEPLAVPPPSSASPPDCSVASPPPTALYPAAASAPQGRSYTYTVPTRSYSYTVPDRSYTLPARTSYYSYGNSMVPLGRTYSPSMSADSHRRVTRAAEPGHSFTRMPVLLRDPETLVVIPHRRQLTHVADALGDDPVLQYYEDRLHETDEINNAHASRRIIEMLQPIAIPKKFYPRAVEWKPKPYKRRTIEDELKPVRHNIAVRSYFDRNKEAADHDSKRIGSGNVSCLNFVGGKVTSRRPRTRFYDHDKIRTEIDLLSRYGHVRDDLDLHQFKDKFPGARQFRDEVKRRLLSRDPFARPSLDQLEGHDFFSNEFNQIHGFLENLVLKSQEERKTFFIDLASRLRAYPEELVASRLSSLCLSRLVLLDPDACRHFLPRLLSPRYDQYATGECVLSPTVFRRHIVPQLLRILHVHDAHIRLVLLQHFSKYVAEIPKHLLGDVVLPELLLGIRDTHDDLVAATLRALADLVPILGSQVVIGPHRHKHFGNGTPKASSGKGATPARRKRVTLSQKATEAPPERRRTLLELSQAAAGESDSLPERRSPEGGEELGLEPDLGPAADAPSDPGSDSELGPGVESEEDVEDGGDWSDWEATDVDPDPPTTREILVQSEDSGAVSAGFELSPTPLEAGSVPQKEAASGKAVIEVKVSKCWRKEPEAEVDLFADMQPVIRSSRPTLLAPEPAPAGPKTDPKPQPRQEVKPELEPEVVSSRLDMSFQSGRR